MCSLSTLSGNAIGFPRADFMFAVAGESKEDLTSMSGSNK
jgi:hypothetical protein